MDSLELFEFLKYIMVEFLFDKIYSIWENWINRYIFAEKSDNLIPFST